MSTEAVIHRTDIFEQVVVQRPTADHEETPAIHQLMLDLVNKILNVVEWKIRLSHIIDSKSCFAHLIKRGVHRLDVTRLKIKRKIVVAFENVTNPWIARADLPQKIRDAISASLLELEDSKIIGELGCSGFTKATPKDYNLVREAMKNAEAFTPEEESEDPN